MSLAYVEYQFDPVKGAIVDGTISHKPTATAVPAGVWKVRAIAERIHVGDSDDSEVGEGNWNGTAITNRMGAPNEAQWSAVEATAQTASAFVPPATAPVDVVRNPGRMAVLTALAAFIGMMAIIWGYGFTGRTETWVEHAMELALLAIALGATLYAFLGFTRACPKCKAWFQRERTGRDSLGERQGLNTFQNSLNGPVHQHATKFDEYADHFRCRRCQRTWTASVYKHVRNA